MRSQEGPLSVASIAGHVGMSSHRLRFVFRQVTGRNVVVTRREFCLEKARRLLSQTAMSIGEVAYASGFENQSAFGRLFRQHTGTSPRLYRQTLQDNGSDSPTTAASVRNVVPVLHDDLASSRLANWWFPQVGEWRPCAPYLEAHATDWAVLHLFTPLPESFRLEFDVQTEQALSKDVRTLRLSLFDPEHDTRYADAILACSDRTEGALRIWDRVIQTNPAARLAPPAWHSVRVEILDNRLVVFLNRRRILAFRDLFSPPYSRRRRLELCAHRGIIRLRRFRLFDLGFPPVVPNIRQGDALFNSGLFEQAREFYLRHLRPGLPADEEIELRFKAGLCLNRQNRQAECRDWIQNIMPLARTPEWRRECDLLLLQVDAETGPVERFERHAKTSMKDPPLRDGIRLTVTDYFDRLQKAGFLEQALRIGHLGLTVDRGVLSSTMAVHAHEPLAKILKKIKRFKEAQRLLRPLCHNHHASDVRVAALASLFDICLLQRQYVTAQTIIRQIGDLDQTTARPYLCAIMKASCLRAQREFTQADAQLRAVRSIITDCHRAELLYCLGRLEEANHLAEQIRETKSPEGHPADRRDLRFLEHLQTGRYAGLAAWLLEESRRNTRDLFAQGQSAVTAGILLELVGQPKDARSAWQETVRRFTPDRCYFWGTMAKALAAGKPEHLENLHHYYSVRSEMFYLLGLLHEHRGNTARARRLFSLSFKEAPLLNWPAHLASIKLQGDQRPRDS